MMTKHSQMKVIVLRSLPTLTPIANQTRLYNPSTDAYNIVVGEGGFFKTKVPSLIPVGESGNPQAVNGTTAAIAVNDSIKFIQRRDTSKDASTLYTRPLEESQWISPQCYLGVKITHTVPSLGTNNIVVAGNNVTGSVALTPEDEFTYRIQVSAHGDRTDWYNSVYNTPTAFGTFTTSATFTTDYPTVARQTDFLIQSLAYNFNGNNGNLAVMICIDNASTTGAIRIRTNAGELLDPLTYPNGVKFTIGYALDGRAVTMTMDAEVRQAFATFIANNPLGFGAANYYIRPYLIPGTNPAPAGVPIAGAAVGSTVTDFIMLSIDEGQAVYDYKINTKRRVTLGLVKGFDQTQQVIGCNPAEAIGSSRSLSIMYKANEAYNQAARPQPYMSYHVQFPNEIVDGGFYDLFYIEHCHQRLATSGMPAVMPHTTVIALPNYEEGSSTQDNVFFEAAGAATPNPLLAYLVDTLDAFNDNFNLGNQPL
jgi:hypothetical protein